MLDCEGHGHKAVVYKSHFPPLRHSVVTETPADTLANKPRLTKDQALCSLCPHDKYDMVGIWHIDCTKFTIKPICLLSPLFISKHICPAWNPCNDVNMLC